MPHTPASPLWKTALQRPWELGFTMLMRIISAKNTHRPPVGHAQRPQQETFRLGQYASFSFAPREIARIEPLPADTLFTEPLASDKTDTIPPLRIELFSLGLLGPGGPLPQHYTEVIREARDNRADHTQAHFLDIFHHRAMTHFYRAWAQGEAAAGLDRKEEEVFSQFIARLSGDEHDLLTPSALPTHARLASAAHRLRQSRNPDGLAQTLQNYFGVPVSIEEYSLYWIKLDTPSQTRLGHAHISTMLGQGAVVGSNVPDRQSRFRITIGPLELEQYLRFTPKSMADEYSDLATLIEWVRAFVGFEFDWEAKLLVRSDQARPVQLGGQERLGWSTWLGVQQSQKDEAVVGMVFEPEIYARDRDLHS